MITIKELNEKYQAINPLWNLAGVEAWLAKKGIERDIIDTTIKQALLDFSQETLPETTFIFDNTRKANSLAKYGEA